MSKTYLKSDHFSGGESITGHASLKEIVRYTDTVDRKRLARAAIDKVKAGTASGQPITRLAKKGQNP